MTDGAGGAVFAWYTSSPSLQCRAQRILANGTEAFPHQGVELSTQGMRLRVSPSVAWNPATGEVYAFWEEISGNQQLSGLWGQKLDGTGARQWTTDGKQVVALGFDQISNVRAFLLGSDPAVAWVQSLAFDDQILRGTRLNSGGSFVWNPPITNLATASTPSSRISAGVSSAGFAAFAWQDGSSGNSDILAQNLTSAGSLGPLRIFADGFESGNTLAWTATIP